MYKRILVPVDGSATSNRGLDEAMALAKSSGGDLHLVHVIDLHAFMYASSDGMVMADATLNSLHEAGRALLARFEAKVTGAGLKVSSGMVDTVAGTVGHAIVEQAQAFNADLIVMGTHGRRGVRRLILGSDAATVASLAKVPVLLVRGPETDKG